jgi:hypothetical protein
MYWRLFLHAFRTLRLLWVSILRNGRLTPALRLHITGTRLADYTRGTRLCSWRQKSPTATHSPWDDSTGAERMWRSTSSSTTTMSKVWCRAQYFGCSLLASCLLLWLGVWNSLLGTFKRIEVRHRKDEDHEQRRTPAPQWLQCSRLAAGREVGGMRRRNDAGGRNKVGTG